MNNNKFETGATTHAVNDLILFTDNTRELAKHRDAICKLLADDGLNPYEADFKPLLTASIEQYIKEFPNNEDHAHIYGMTAREKLEYRQLYVTDFENWKSEHGYK